MFHSALPSFTNGGGDRFVFIQRKAGLGVGVGNLLKNSAQWQNLQNESTTSISRRVTIPELLAGFLCVVELVACI